MVEGETVLGEECVGLLWDLHLGVLCEWIGLCFRGVKDCWVNCVKGLFVLKGSERLLCELLGGNMGYGVTVVLVVYVCNIMGALV